MSLLDQVPPLNPYLVGGIGLGVLLLLATPSGGGRRRERRTQSASVEATSRRGGDRELRRREDAGERLRARIQRHQRRTDVLEDQAQEAERRAATAMRARDVSAARARAERARRGIVREVSEIERLEELLDRVEAGDNRAVRAALAIRNPTDPILAAAMALSETFHGTPHEVIELAPSEQQISRFLVALGRLPELRYVPDGHSERGGVEWVHTSGDRGFGRRPSDRQPWLAVDPRTRRPVIVPMRSPLRFDAARGLEG